eukprot:c28910_g1_i1 orf=21-185(-)
MLSFPHLLSRSSTTLVACEDSYLLKEELRLTLPSSKIYRGSQVSTLKPISSTKF